MATPADLGETLPLAEGTSRDKRMAIRMGRAVSVVFFVSIAARMLTLASQVFIAAIFGTSSEMDAYVLALVVPTTIAGVLSVAVGAAIIPIFIEYREHHDEEAAMRVFWTATTLGTLLALLLTGVMIAAAPVLMVIIGHTTQTLAVTLLRFLMPIMLLQGLITLFGALLNAYGRFAASSLLSAANAISIITFLLLFHHAWGIYALAWGTLAGYGLNLLFLIVACQRIGLHFRPGFDWHHPAIRRIAVIATPALLGSILAHANILVDQAMAAFLPAGSVAGLNYAVKLVDTPSQFFYTALSTALLPVFAMQAARRELTLIRDTFRQVVILSAILLLPAGALFSVLARPVVEVLFQHGQFDAGSTDTVSGAIALLAPGIFFVTYSFVNARAFQALQDNWTLAWVSLLMVFLNGVFDYLLMQVCGVAGIAFATTLTYLIATVVLLLILDRKLGGLKLGQLALSVGKALFAAGLMWLIVAFLERVPVVGQIPLLVQITLLGVGGLVLYITLLWVLQVREVSILWAMVQNRLPFKSPDDKNPLNQEE